jgi:hypothetical protein
MTEQNVDRTESIDPLVTLYVYRKHGGYVVTLWPQIGELLDVLEVHAYDRYGAACLYSQAARATNKRIKLGGRAAGWGSLGDDSYEPGAERDVLTGIISEALDDARPWEFAPVYWELEEITGELAEGELHTRVDVGALHPATVSYLRERRAERARARRLADALVSDTPEVVEALAKLEAALRAEREAG